jgi:dihydrofolate reductase
MSAPLALIVATDSNGVIGDEKGRIPWRAPRDMRHFRNLTMRHPVIMGRKTAESLGRALPGRLNIVLTRDRTWCRPGFHAFWTPELALQFAQFYAESRHYLPKIFIIGGAEIYHAFAKKADELYHTEIGIESAGTVKVDLAAAPAMLIRMSEEFAADDANPPMCFMHFQRNPTDRAAGHWDEEWFRQ